MITRASGNLLVITALPNSDACSARRRARCDSGLTRANRNSPGGGSATKRAAARAVRRQRRDTVATASSIFWQARYCHRQRRHQLPAGKRTQCRPGRSATKIKQAIGIAPAAKPDNRRLMQKRRGIAAVAAIPPRETLRPESAHCRLCRKTIYGTTAKSIEGVNKHATAKGGTNTSAMLGNRPSLADGRRQTKG